jgi:hypothetical protein
MLESRSEHGYVLRLGLGDESLERMASTLVLTRRRARRFAVPFFFDLGDERPPNASSLDPLVGLASYGWSTYYPALVLERHGEIDRMLISPQVMGALTLPNIEAFKSYFLDRLVAASRRLDPKIRRAVIRLQHDAHRGLEMNVLERARSHR